MKTATKEDWKHPEQLAFLISLNKTYGVVNIYRVAKDVPEEKIIADHEKVFRQLWLGGRIWTRYDMGVITYVYKRQQETLKRKLGHLYRDVSPRQTGSDGQSA